MEKIKIYKKVEFVKPVMVAGWPGMGNVALETVDYLRKKLGAVKFAEIQIDEMSALDCVVVEDGMAKLPKPPSYIFYYAKNQNLIIFEAQAQLPGQCGINLLNKVLDLALEFKVVRIYTGAAFPVPIGCKDEPEVYGATNKQSLKTALVKSGVKMMDEGQIFGLNGILLGFAEKKNIEAVCLLATMPHYAISLPNPKASAAIIRILSRILSFKVDLKELEDYSQEMDSKMEIIEGKVKDIFPVGEERREAPSEEKKVPGYIIEKIEHLFREAASDKKKAGILKKELDRWDLYAMYEDRFLDLFKENQ
jgi:proteasome assembly chaperone (PAC2) family protein